MDLSIITINYNNADGLNNTIQSVLNQKYKSIEYIVIDGGSTDRSVSVIEDNLSIINYWVSESDKGIYDAMNKGIVKASGRYLMFLNSGDCLIDDSVLSACIAAIERNSSVDVFYGNMRVVNSGYEGLWFREYPSVLSISFLKEDTLNHQSSLIRKELFEEFGYYPSNYKLASDYWLYLIAFLHDKIFKHLDFFMVEYDLSGVSVTKADSYLAEKDAIWQQLVPRYARETVAQQLQYKAQLSEYQTLASTSLVKVGIQSNAFYQAIRQFLRKSIKK